MKKQKTLKAIINVLGMGVQVLIVDQRLNFGRVQYKIKPAAGNGFTWKDEQSVLIVDTFRVDYSGLI